METIIITPKNKQAIPFLKHLLNSLDEVKSIEVVSATKMQVANEITEGLKDAKDLLAGKRTPKSLKQLLDED